MHRNPAAWAPDTEGQANSGISSNEGRSQIFLLRLGFYNKPEGPPGICSLLAKSPEASEMPLMRRPQEEAVWRSNSLLLHKGIHLNIWTITLEIPPSRHNPNTYTLDLTLTEELIIQIDGQQLTLNFNISSQKSLKTCLTTSLIGFKGTAPGTQMSLLIIIINQTNTKIRTKTLKWWRIKS